jgi:shikimate kinase
MYCCLVQRIDKIAPFYQISRVHVSQAMKAPQNIFLIGLMGSGKSTLGKRLSEDYKKTYIDSDREIEQKTGASISLIFDIEGEQGFRDREVRMIDELTNKKEIVLATGGGAVLDSKNRTCLAARGYVIYLQVEPYQLLERTAQDKNRPLLQTDNPLAVLETLCEQRDPLYRETADWVLNTTGMSLHNVAKCIHQQFETI